MRMYIVWAGGVMGPRWAINWVKWSSEDFIDIRSRTDRWRRRRCCRPCRVPPHRWARPTPAWPRCSPWPHTLKLLLIALSPAQREKTRLRIHDRHNKTNSAVVFTALCQTWSTVWAFMATPDRCKMSFMLFFFPCSTTLRDDLSSFSHPFHASESGNQSTLHRSVNSHLALRGSVEREMHIYSACCRLLLPHKSFFQS